MNVIDMVKKEINSSITFTDDELMIIKCYFKGINKVSEIQKELYWGFRRVFDAINEINKKLGNEIEGD